MAHTIHVPLSSPRAKYAKKTSTVSISIHSSASSQNTLQQKQLKPVPPLPPDTSDLPANRWREHGIFAGLVFITITSFLLLLGNLRTWVLPIRLQTFVTNNRATTSILVQIVSSIFGFLQITPICAVINRATRLFLSEEKASLDQLRFWSLLCSRGLDWHLPWKHLLVLWAFLLFALNPTAVWTGALTPVDMTTFRTDSGTIPSYAEMSMIREYPSEFRNAAYQSQIRNTKGVFSYGVGVTLEGDLLASAASSTTVDGSTRQHKKLDNSGLTYNGRSYEIASSAGLLDGDPMNDKYATGYTYQESGYNADVQCLYNTSSAFQISPIGDAYPLLWNAQGQLPNSPPGQGELSDYIGHGSGPVIFAIGVASTQTSGPKYLAIASGASYASLNQTQCTITFNPTLCNVTIKKLSNTISVIPTLAPTSDIDPSGNLSHISVRQFELISNDQTNLYQSLVGNSFMRSIDNYQASQQANGSGSLTLDDITLSGLQNSIIAMLDDILVGYASAQLMVARQHSTTSIIITIQSMQIGEFGYIVAEVALDLLVMLIVIIEMIRTRGWKGLGVWDYMDVRNLVISSSRGGTDVSSYIDGIGDFRERTWMRGIKSWEDFMEETGVRFVKEKGALVLAEKRKGHMPRGPSSLGSEETLIKKQDSGMTGGLESGLGDWV